MIDKEFVIHALRRGNGNGTTIQQLIPSHLSGKEKSAARKKISRILNLLESDYENTGVSVKKNDGCLETDSEVRDTRKGYWTIKNESGLTPDVEAIIKVSAIKFAKFFLPPKQRAHLETLVNKQLEKEKYSGKGGILTKEKEWMDVVDIISRYPLIYPSYHENYQEIEDVVIASMHKDCAFEAAYGEEKAIKLLYPVRLIRREQVLYVTCSESRYKDNQKFKDYAIHRLSNVSEKPSERNIEVTDEEIKQNSERKKDKVLSLLKLRIQGIAVEHFKTVRFHESLSEQKKTQYEDWYINGKNRKEKADGIVLTVNDIEYTYEMETWLLGFGGNVEVLEPKNIRDEMKAHAKKMADIYINEKSD